MDLRSSYPYWFVKSGLINSYPRLSENLSCDVVVIGAGITGALCAYYLVEAGVKVIVVDKRHIGLGSTCASTALLQYEIDKELHELIDLVGEENAVRSYLLCYRAIDELEKISKKLSIDCDFKKTHSIYLASIEEDIENLEKEYLIRKRIGIDLEILSQKELFQLTGLKNSAALLSRKAAQMDAYKFTHGLFQYIQKKGCKVYDTTAIDKIIEHNNNVELSCKNGNSITCEKYIFANGYESQLYLKDKVARLHSTYAIISKPLAKKFLKKLNFLFWESARPYLYFRITEDNRILVGGKDETFYSPGKRDRLINKKAKQLEKAFMDKFPDVPFETDFSWAGTFAETKDGLPFIGQNKEYKHAYFALGFGGNGITFSQVAGEIISLLYKNGKAENADLFSFKR